MTSHPLVPRGTVLVPRGTVLVADADTSSYDGGRLLLGGSPPRVLRLTDDGAERARGLLAGAPVADDVGAALARRLLNGGLAHPVSMPSVASSVEVVVPAFGSRLLSDCLSSLRRWPITVVDDGSPDEAAVAEVAKRAGAAVVRLPANAGPAAARNAGLAATTAPIVAFVDSDVEVTVETLRCLAAMLDDPAVGAVAPRIRPVKSPRPTLASSRLDLGPRPGVVRPGSRVSYVPSTVLVVRRAAIEAVGGFDEELRVGEDVDLVWRLVAAGWTVRYAPDLAASHHEPRTWIASLDRSRRYGAATGPLAVRHPGVGTAALSPPILPVAAVLLAAASRPRTGAMLLGAATLGPLRRLRGAGVPRRDAVTTTATATLRSTAYAARWLTQIWSPALVLMGSRALRRRDRSAGLALLAACSGALLVDDVAYGVGVWTGCLRSKSLRPLMPRHIRRR